MRPLTELSLFINEQASGARLNRGKSKGMWAGSWKVRSVQRRIFLRVRGLAGQVHPKFWGLIGVFSFVLFSLYLSGMF